MATVPRLTAPSVAPTAAPDFREQNPVNADLLNISARQTQQAGAALVGLGGEMEAIRRQMVDQANALRVDDAVNQATERALRLQHDPKDGYTALKGFDALSRESGLPLYEEYTGKLDKDINDIASTLGNERQRAMFQMKVNNIRTQFKDGAMVYQGKQADDYELSVREAGVKTSANALVLNYADPKNVEMQEQNIRASIMGAIDPTTGQFIRGAAQMQGKSAAWAQQKADEAVSGAHLGAIKSALEKGDVNGAMAYRKQYGSRMTASDMLQIDGTLQRDYDVRQGAAVASQIVSSTKSTVDPTSFDRLTNIVQGIESKGRAFGADGSLLQGPVTRNGERAQGDMQVMPSTAKDPGYGIKPADMSGTKEQQAAELRRVGQQKLAVLVKMYDGDIAKAAAAYNWGEGNVDKAVKAAQQNAGKGEQVPADAWLANAPAETRNYVTSVLKQMNTPDGGAPQRPTLESLHQAARERLGPGASPLAVKTAVDQISQQYEDQNKAIAQRKEETISQAMQQLAQNGGRFSELSAGMRANLTRYAPDKLDDVMNFGQRIAKGDDTTDDRLYLRLSSNPQAMANMSDAQFYQLRGGLSQSDFQHFSKQRSDILSGKTGNGAGDLNEPAINRVFNQRLQTLGIPINPDKRDAAAEQRAGAMRSFIDKQVAAAQQAVGRKLNDVETQKVIDETFAQNVAFRSTWLGLGGGGSGPLLNATIDTIPSDVKDKITKAFAAKGNTKPTDGQILGVYFEGMSAQSKKPRAGGATGAF